MRDPHGTPYLTQKISMNVAAADYAKVLTVAKETRTPVGVIARAAFVRGLSGALDQRKRMWKKEQATLAQIARLKDEPKQPEVDQ